MGTNHKQLIHYLTGESTENHLILYWVGEIAIRVIGDDLAKLQLVLVKLIHT